MWPRNHAIADEDNELQENSRIASLRYLGWLLWNPEPVEDAFDLGVFGEQDQPPMAARPDGVRRFTDARVSAAFVPAMGTHGILECAPQAQVTFRGMQADHA